MHLATIKVRPAATTRIMGKQKAATAPAQRRVTGVAIWRGIRISKMHSGTIKVRPAATTRIMGKRKAVTAPAQRHQRRRHPRRRRQRRRQRTVPCKAVQRICAGMVRPGGKLAMIAALAPQWTVQSKAVPRIYAGMGGAGGESAMIAAL